MNTEEKPFWNPYLAGVALGLVLLATYLVMGFGLGASGAMIRFGTWVGWMAAPQAMESHPFFCSYVGEGKKVLEDWLVFEVVGVFLGGVVAAYSAGRLRPAVQQGARPVGVTVRLSLALVGGFLMGIGARYGHGCTSGQALTGGALLSTGSWAFMMSVFGGGYLLAPLLRRVWR